MLYGREQECRRIEELIGAACDGNGGVLVLHGEIGIGKSALLDRAATQADGLLVLRGSGGPSQAELPFAALHQLLRPLLGRLDRLPEPQADALRSAFGLMPLQPVDRLLVALGALTLLSEAAEQQPILCLVDDGQWLDEPSAETVWFLAKRLATEKIAMLIAVRPDGLDRYPGAPELPVTGLEPAAAAEFLAERHPELSAQVRARVIAETSANPLALSELPTAMTSGQQAGIESLIGPLPVPDCIRQHYLNQLDRLPEATRLILLAAAADNDGELTVVLRAARSLNVDPTALDAAESAGLVRIADNSTGPRVVFRHPLVRAAVYSAGTYSQRAAVHRAIAYMVDPELDPDRRAWHLAASASQPDDAVAAELEHSALRAQQRGAPATAATALERSARLTTSVVVKARRLVTAAQAAYAAGQPARAAALADEAEQMTDDFVVRARACHLRAGIAFDRGSPATLHAPLLANAASVAPEHPELAAALLIDAVKNAWFINDPDSALEASAALQGVSLPPNSPQRSTVATVLGLADRLEVLRGTRSTLAHQCEPQEPSEPLALVLSALASLALGDDIAALQASEAGVRSCRSLGQTALLVIALQVQATAELLIGRHRFARATASEALQLASVLGQDNRISHLRAILAWLDALAGDEGSCRDLAAAAIGHAEPLGIAPTLGLARWATGLLDLGLGHPERTLEQWQLGHGGHPILSVRLTPDLVEAAARAGRSDEVKPEVDQLTAWAAASRLPWAHAVDARCRAVLASDDLVAAALFEEALACHEAADRSGPPRPFDRARTQLLYGEWLRRKRRRTEARAPLHAAQQTFEQLGATLWANRAGSELRAAGSQVTAGKPAVARLTAQELQVVRLAGAGLSNREIGAQLFISPRTVGYHLHKSFAKLGVRSRVELAQFAVDSDAG
jgi:DNA-binding CsgD family transcriptional regulator